MIYSNGGFSGGTKASPDIAKFPLGSTSRAGNGTVTSNVGVTLSADSAEDIFFNTPGAAIIQNLPQTDVKAGKRFRFFVSGATESNYVAIRSNNGTEIDRIGGNGHIIVVAKIDAPSTPSDWRLVEVEETTNEFTGTPTGANPNQIKAYFKRKNEIVCAKFAQATATAAAAATITLPAGFVPARFRTSSFNFSNSPCTVYSSNASESGTCAIGNTGNVNFFRYSATNYGGTCGVSPSANDYTSTTYLK